MTCNMLKPYFNKLLIEAGCDEAGRGCLAGPVFAAAVILPKGEKKDFKALRKVKDSKQLTHELRNELRPVIEKTALAFAVEMVSVEEIDKINILNASFLAMHRAIAKLGSVPELLLIDGNRFNEYCSPEGKKIEHQCIIEGDDKFLAIACASVLAKTYRDDYMVQLHEQFPNYGWIHNKGYATASHRFAIERYGILDHHRKSFTLLDAEED